MIGGIEAGGTKFVCAVGNAHGDIFDQVSLPTTDPDQTMQAVKEFFDRYPIEALGVGSFGPIDLDSRHNTYGTILNTPKTKWKHYNLLGRLKKDFSVPVYLDTDVNAACLGEYLYGAGKNADSTLYITVGTGIGAGFVHKGQTYQGKSHPEMGHILIRKHHDDTFAGSCPYHDDCLEGLASGTAIEQRYGMQAPQLEHNDEVWELETFYLAQAITNYVMILSPERIILGGGVMKQDKLYDMIREKCRELINDYIATGNIENVIVPPALKDEQGIKGAMALVDRF